MSITWSLQDSTHYDKTLELLRKYDPDFAAAEAKQRARLRLSPAPAPRPVATPLQVLPIYALFPTATARIRNGSVKYARTCTHTHHESFNMSVAATCLGAQFKVTRSCT